MEQEYTEETHVFGYDDPAADGIHLALEIADTDDAPPAEDEDTGAGLDFEHERLLAWIQAVQQEAPQSVQGGEGTEPPTDAENGQQAPTTGEQQASPEEPPKPPAAKKAPAKRAASKEG